MSGSMKNGLLLAAVILLTLIPLMTVTAPSIPGADAQAQEVVQTLAPGYQPWFESLFTPPSVEIESLLFALQAALGAGVLGYYAGYVRGKRAKSPTPDDVERAH